MSWEWQMVYGRNKMKMQFEDEHKGEVQDFDAIEAEDENEKIWN